MHLPIADPHRLLASAFLNYNKAIPHPPEQQNDDKKNTCVSPIFYMHGIRVFSALLDAEGEGRESSWLKNTNTNFTYISHRD